MSKYYPGWIARLYTDYEIKDPIFGKLCRIACQYLYLDICHVKDLPGTPHLDGSKFFPMNWRYFPTLDPQVPTSKTYTYIRCTLFFPIFRLFTARSP